MTNSSPLHNTAIGEAATHAHEGLRRELLYSSRSRITFDAIREHLVNDRLWEPWKANALTFTPALLYYLHHGQEDLENPVQLGQRTLDQIYLVFTAMVLEATSELVHVAAREYAQAAVFNQISFTASIPGFRQ